MSYQTEECRPMLGANKTEEVATISKKQSFGLATLMVLCMAATSFMAGHAYSSAATASASAVQLDYPRSLWTTQDSCWRMISSVYRKCGDDKGECAYKEFTGKTYDYAHCNPDGACKFEFDIIQHQCNDYQSY